MASPSSNFRRQPAIRKFSGECSVHGQVDLSEVEQLDGPSLARSCKRCQWDGLHIAPIDSEAHRQALAQQKAERLNSALIGAGITPRFAGCTLENFQAGDNAAMAKALSVCQLYAENFPEHRLAGRSLILSGNVGTGKTHLATGIVQAVIRTHGASALIVSAAEIVRVSRGTMVKGAEYTDRDVLNELASVDLLVIDEVGAQKGSEYELGLLHEVIDRRYQLVLPTVLVSNLQATELAGFIGDRALDRLRQGKGQLIGFTWASMRAKA